MTAPDTDRQRATAFHEAGHAVVAHRFGHLVDSVTIKPKPGILGSSASEEEFSDGSTDREQVLVLYAGLAAERLVRPGAVVEDGAWSDYEKAERLVACLGVPVEELEREAAELVHKHRVAIEAVAEVLLEHTSISGEEVLIIADSIDEGSDWRIELPRYRRNQLYLASGGAEGSPD